VPPKFPIDAPQACVIRTLALLGFRVVREREHIALVRENAAGTRTPLTLPNYARIKGSTPRHVCMQAGIPRAVFLETYKRS
jgi:hypothetical protein